MQFRRKGLTCLKKEKSSGSKCLEMARCGAGTGRYSQGVPPASPSPSLARSHDSLPGRRERSLLGLFLLNTLKRIKNCNKGSGALEQAPCRDPPRAAHAAPTHDWRRQAPPPGGVGSPQRTLRGEVAAGQRGSGTARGMKQKLAGCARALGKGFAFGWPACKARQGVRDYKCGIC